MRPKSALFRVTTPKPCASALAAIQRSCAPGTSPRRASPAQISACTRATGSVIGTGSSPASRCSTKARRRFLRAPEARSTPCSNSLTVTTLIARSSDPTRASRFAAVSSRSQSIRTSVSIRTARSSPEVLRPDVARAPRRRIRRRRPERRPRARESALATQAGPSAGRSPRPACRLAISRSPHPSQLGLVPPRSAERRRLRSTGP